MLIKLDCDWHEIPRPSVMEKFWENASDKVNAAVSFVDDVGSQLHDGVASQGINRAIGTEMEKQAHEYIAQQRQLKSQP